MASPSRLSFLFCVDFLDVHFIPFSLENLLITALLYFVVKTSTTIDQLSLVPQHKDHDHVITTSMASPT